LGDCRTPGLIHQEMTMQSLPLDQQCHIKCKNLTMRISHPLLMSWRIQLMLIYTIGSQRLSVKLNSLRKKHMKNQTNAEELNEI